MYIHCKWCDNPQMIVIAQNLDELQADKHPTMHVQGHSAGMSINKYIVPGLTRFAHIYHADGAITSR
jgi:hypothetical protein